MSAVEAPGPATRTLGIRLLGPLEVVVADRPVVVDTRKALAIVALVAVSWRNARAVERLARLGMARTVGEAVALEKAAEPPRRRDNGRDDDGRPRYLPRDPTEVG